MSLQPFIPGLVVLLVLSAGAMYAGAAYGYPALSAGAAGLFAVAVIAVAVRINRPFWGPNAISDAADQKLHSIRRNARLAVLIYAWGAAAMFAVYGLSGLQWRHGLQYASGMMLIAAAIFAFVHFAGPESRLRRPEAVERAYLLNIGHGIAAAGALLFLLLSGKLWAGKSDWAANHVFLAGTVSLIALCAITATTHRALSKQHDSTGDRHL